MKLADGGIEAPVKRPRRRFKRIIGISLAVVLLLAGGISFYVWQLGAEARKIYKLGSSLNTFLGDYASSMKRRNVEAVLDKYHDDYSGVNEGDWNEKMFWKDEHARNDEGVRVYLWEQTNARAFAKEDVRKQIEGLLGRIDYVNLAKFKIEAIEENDGLGSATLKTLLWLRGQQEDGEKVETHAYFRLWLADEDGWKIKRKELLHGVTVRGKAVGFADVTKEAGIDFVASHNSMLQEAEWRPDVFEIMQYAHGGVTAADYDGDGWDDIYFADGQKPRLYRNQRDGTFRDVTTEAGLPDVLRAVNVALFADLDNDGDPELFLARSSAENKLFRNNGNGTFTDVTEDANLGGYWVATASAADYDNDGLLDLYLGRYLDPRKNLPTTLFYTRNSEGNSLLRNQGDLRFKDVTEDAGVREGGLTLGIAWGDYDSDGDLDAYVANDFGRNALFRNDTTDDPDNEARRVFTDVSKESGTFDISYGMSSSWADLDNDNDLDIYVSNVHSGQRWFGNEATLRNYIATSIKQGAMREDKPLFDEILHLLDGNWASLGDRVIRGNSMFLNEGDGTFSDPSEEYRVNPHGWYWGSVVFDYDNDGLQDIYAVNGWITGKDPADL